MIGINKSALRQTTWAQSLLRFAPGGFITVAAGLIAKARGPVFGGLFLTFPAVFPATLTLVARHERDKKREHGLHGRRRGIQAAAVDAGGTTLGSAGLAAFAAWLVWKKNRRRRRS